MEMTTVNPRGPRVEVAALLGAIVALSFVVAPLLAASAFAPSVLAGSDYPMEIIRAQTHYQVADPATSVLVGIGVHGGR